MNSLKGHLFARDRIQYSFRALVDRTLREQHREERRLAEQRAYEDISSTQGTRVP